MQRFILQENVALLQRRLAEAADAGLCRTLRCLLSSAQRELALFDMAASGIGTGLAPRGSAHGQFPKIRGRCIDSVAGSTARHAPTWRCILVPACISSTSTVPMPRRR